MQDLWAHAFFVRKFLGILLFDNIFSFRSL